MVKIRNYAMIIIFFWFKCNNLFLLCILRSLIICNNCKRCSQHFLHFVSNEIICFIINTMETSTPNFFYFNNINHNWTQNFRFYINSNSIIQSSITCERLLFYQICSHISHSVYSGSTVAKTPNLFQYRSNTDSAENVKETVGV